MLARQSETTKRPLCEILFCLYKILKNISASLYFCSIDFAEFDFFICLHLVAFIFMFLSFYEVYRAGCSELVYSVVYRHLALLYYSIGLK